MGDQKKTKAQLLGELEILRQAQAAQQQLVEELQARVERYRSVVDNVVDGIITVDAQDTILSFNPAAEEIFGYPASQAIGQNVAILMAEPHPRERGQYIQNYLRTGEKKVIGAGREVLGRRRDGTIFPMDLAVNELHLGGRRLFTGIVRDITERKRLEGQLLQAQKMESIGQFAGGIAHDFNNQLGIILFDLDMLIASVGEESTWREDLGKIRKVAVRAADLTRKLLLFSRRQQMELGALNLNQQIREMQRMLGRLLSEDIRVELRLAEDMWTINADPTAIDQILINLSVNARDAMPQGGVLSLETRNALVDAAMCRQHAQARAGRFACLVVRDTGTGMAEEVRKRIFEPFFTTKEAGKGTGLGLAVVYGLVQAHEGWIAVESSPGNGSMFAIYLPALERETAEADVAAAAGPAQESGRSERILVIEDEPDLRERTERVLAQNGYAVWTCCTAAEARAVFRQENGRFDLVLADMVLPDGKGLDLVVQFLGEQSGLAVLLITGYFDERIDWTRVQGTGAPLLCKPFAVEELLDQVRVVLRQRKGRASEHPSL